MGIPINTVRSNRIRHRLAPLARQELLGYGAGIPCWSKTAFSSSLSALGAAVWVPRPSAWEEYQLHLFLRKRVQQPWSSAQRPYVACSSSSDAHPQWWAGGRPRLLFAFYCWHIPRVRSCPSLMDTMEPRRVFLAKCSACDSSRKLFATGIRRLHSALNPQRYATLALACLYSVTLQRKYWGMFL